MVRNDIILRVLYENVDYLKRIEGMDPEKRQKIIDTISSIDNLIDLHTQKLELLKQHRKGLLQKLIPDKN
jgi:type I restriction enzyme S subunit